MNDSTAGAAQRAPEPNGADLLRVFLDCGPCDDEYLRREIAFVNYVRDRRDAQVHVLITRENTGGGGDAWTLDFYGIDDFSGMDDQLVFYTTQDDTDDSERRALAQMLRLGLVRYAAQTPLGQQLRVSTSPRVARWARARVTNAQPQDDPWNFWVFRTRLNMFFDAEERESRQSVSGSISANRDTEMWKMRVGFFTNYREDTFQLTDSTFSNVRRSSSLDARFVKSVGEHVGIGFGGSAISSNFRNQDLTLRGAPAIEYNFFPYSESTRRQFTVTYTAGYNAFRYIEPTIFDRHGRAPRQPRRAELVPGQRALGRERAHPGVLAVPRPARSAPAGAVRRARHPPVPRLLSPLRRRQLADPRPDLPAAPRRHRRRESWYASASSPPTTSGSSASGSPTRSARSSTTW